VNSVKRIEPNETLKRDLERLWTTESFGIKPDVQLPVTPEERRAWKILKSSTKHNGERYECSLLWSSDEVKLPDNREAARKRFYGIERRLNCKRDYAERYASAMSRYMELGHARLLTAPELPGPVGRTWYLPHHGVENNGKLRIVFDASAEFQGVSLNDVVMKGPDLLQPQFGVLTRFRERAVAVSADIEKMFNQVLVPKHDQSALRFIWRPLGNMDRKPTRCRSRFLDAYHHRRFAITR